MSCKNIIDISNKEHIKVWHLLPWYVNHSLDPVEHECVKNHVKTCIACRIELNQQQQLFEEMQQTDHLRQVSQVSFAQLKKRMEEQPEHKKVLKLCSHQLSGFIKFAAIAASLLLLATPLLFNSVIVEPELAGEYRTLANPSEGEQRNNIVRVVFSGQLDSEQISALLRGVSGHVVKGPSKNNVYEIQIGYQQTDQQELNEAIAHLRENPLVVFAERAH